MYVVRFRFTGQGLWNTSLLPVSAQAAFTQARALQRKSLSDEVEVVSTQTRRLVDLRA